MADHPERTTITAIHAAHEQAWMALTTIEQEEAALGDTEVGTGNHEEKCQWAEARATCLRRITALQIALLYVAPETWADALILLHHVRDLYDAVTGGGRSNGAEQDREAVAIAIDALFNFIATERQEIDHEAIGPYFHRSTLQAWQTAHKRAGVVE